MGDGKADATSAAGDDGGAPGEVDLVHAVADVGIGLGSRARGYRAPGCTAAVPAAIPGWAGLAWGNEFGYIAGMRSVWLASLMIWGASQGVWGVDGSWVRVGTTVAAPRPEAFGAHVGLRMNHPTFLDSSFEGISFRWRFDVRGGDARSAWIGNGHIYDTIRSGFLDGATAWVYRLGDDGVRRVRKATVVRHEAGDPTESASQGRLIFDGEGAVPASGDHVFVAVRWDNPPLDRVASRLTQLSDCWILRSDRVRTSMVRDASTTPPGGGRTSLRVASSGGEARVESHGQFDGAGQGYYPTLEPGKRYRLSIWMRQEGIPGGNVRVGFTSVYAGTQRTHAVSGEWREYMADYVAPEWPGLGVVSVFELRFEGPGTVWVDRLSFHEVSEPPFAVDTRQRVALRDFAIGSMRTFGAFHLSQSLETWTDEASVASVGWNIDQGGHVMTENKLPVFLRVVKEAGGIPWLVVGGQMTEEEWPQLMEYLAVPFDPAIDSAATKPWAAKRHAQGQTAPWTDVFPKIRIEYCNEAWNSLFAPYAFGSAEYGRFAEYFWARAKESPGWRADRFELVLNGWTLSTGWEGFGATARRQAPSASGVGATAYLGGWERGAFVGGSLRTDAGFQDTLLYAAYDQQRFHRHMVATREAMKSQGHAYDLMVYESGPGYSLPNGGRPYILVEQQYGKSLAAGVCTLDMLLWNSLHGYTAQNYFTFGYGFNWTSHALVANGGHPYPSWLALQMRNRLASGSMVDAQLLSGPTVDVVREDEGIEARFVPWLQPYAFRDGNRYTVFLLSRSLTNALPVVLDLPFRTASRIVRQELTGDPRADNLLQPVIREGVGVELPLTVLKAREDGGRLETSVPPGSVQAWVFEGTAGPETGPGARGVIHAAPGQGSVASEPVVRFRVGWDRPVEGLDAADFILEGSVDFTEAEIRVQPVDAELGLSTLFEVTVSGFSGEGTLRLGLRSGAVRPVGGGEPSAAIPAWEPGLRYRPAPPAHRLLAWEGWDGPGVLGHLAGVSTGRGWSGAWQVQDFQPSDVQEGHRVSDITPLRQAGLDSSGGAYATGGYRYRTAGRGLDVRGAFAEWRVPDSEPAVVGRGGKELWFSCLMRKERANREPLLVALSPSLYAQEHPAWRVAIGYPGDEAPARWTLLYRGSAGLPWVASPTAEPVDAGRPAWLLLRLQFGRRDRLSLWVNPVSAVSSGVLPLPDAEVTGAEVDNLQFRTLAFYGGDSAGQGSVDDLAWGDSWLAVVPGRNARTRLNAARLEGGMVGLRWEGGDGYLLESSRVLGGDALWEPVPAMPEVQDGLPVVRQPLDGTGRFWRLRKRD